MSIDFVTGTPGSGKSYHAVAVHIYENLIDPKPGRSKKNKRRLRILEVFLRRGYGSHFPQWLTKFIRTLADRFLSVFNPRKVITNMPLNLDEFERLRPGISSFIEHREFDPKKVETFQSDWFHQSDGGPRVGPIFVIDEAANYLQKNMLTEPLHEFFRMHRHYGYDYVLMTQAEVSVAPEIRKMCATMDDCTNLETIGFGGSYRVIRYGLVQGQRKSAIFRKIHKYKQSIFRLYQSRTRGGGAGRNAKKAGVKSIFAHPVIIFSGIALATSVYLIMNSPFFNKLKDQQAAEEAVVRTSSSGLSKSSDTSNLELVGISDNGIYVNYPGGMSFWSDEYDYSEIPGRCAIKISNEVIWCGQKLPK